jgi:hypothetical protein
VDDYYRALRFRTDAAIEVAAALTRYNIELVRYEEIKGTLLEFFAIDYLADPCRQAARLPKPGSVPRPDRMPTIPDAPTNPREQLPGIKLPVLDPPVAGIVDDAEATIARVELLPPTPAWSSTSTPRGISLQR